MLYSTTLRVALRHTVQYDKARREATRIARVAGPGRFLNLHFVIK